MIRKWFRNVHVVNYIKSLLLCVKHRLFSLGLSNTISSNHLSPILNYFCTTISSCLYQLMRRKAKPNVGVKAKKFRTRLDDERKKIIIIKFTPKVCSTKVANGTMITLWIPFLTHESQQNTSTQSSWFINTRKSTNIKRGWETKVCEGCSGRKQRMLKLFIVLNDKQKSLKCNSCWR